MIHKRTILITLFFCINFAVAHAQNFRNLDFTQACDSSQTGLCYWDLSWGNKKNVRQDELLGKKCLLIEAVQKGAVVFTEQAANFSPLQEIAIVTVSADIRSENVEGKGAGININVYDKEGQLLTFKDMGNFYSVDWITNTTAWKACSVSLVCPVGTASIKIGAILFGKGKAWFRDYHVTITPVENRKYSKLALKYISSAVDTIKIHSLIRDSLDVTKIKINALHIAGNAKRYSDCYLAINYIIESLREYGDFHSFFMKATEVANWKNGGSVVSKVEYPSYKKIDDFGYIIVPPFHSGNQKIMLAYADSLQSAILDLENSGIKGWIIDIRENTGGNMEPMIAGLGPLFSSEKLGSLVDVDNKYNSWYYKNGRYFTDDDSGWSVSAPVTLRSKLPIAVLISGKVGSSGEIVVISFIGNRDTKFFGQPTMGLTTGNGSFSLMDSSQIFVASTVMTDRDNKRYHGSIPPDLEVKPDTEINAAIQWLKSH